MARALLVASYFCASLLKMRRVCGSLLSYTKWGQRANPTAAEEQRWPLVLVLLVLVLLPAAVVVVGSGSVPAKAPKPTKTVTAAPHRSLPCPDAFSFPSSLSSSFVSCGSFSSLPVVLASVWTDLFVAKNERGTVRGGVGRDKGETRRQRDPPFCCRERTTATFAVVGSLDRFPDNQLAALSSSSSSSSSLAKLRVARSIG